MTAKLPFLLEVGTEEIPAAFLPAATKWLKENFEQNLKDAHLEPEEVQAFATPRRLVVMVKSLLLQQPNRTVEVVGPPVRIAFDESGNPTKAAIGFAKKQNVEVSQLKRITTKKGEFVAAVIDEQGKPAVEILSELVPELLRKIPWQKSMRWGRIKQTFARPVHWIVALLGNEVVPFEFAGVRSNRKSRGHRFAAPDEFEVKNTESFLYELKKRFVVLNAEERKKIIKDGLKRISEENNTILIKDDELLEEVCYLVEYPQVVRGNFEERFLELPSELLITVLREHQKLFCFEHSDGSLAPMFGAVLNTPQNEHTPNIINGNERVVRARLEDARFVIAEDLKHSLEDYAAVLERITFQRDLGSIGDKVRRFTALAKHFAKSVGFDNTEFLSKLERCCLLAKADLASQAVYEFPELQGTMGRYYAQLQGEPKEIAIAIESHWKPRFSGDEPPTDKLGAIISIADKLDTIVGCFSVGIKPTGTKDAFALRRQAIGILQTVFANNFALNIEDIITYAYQLVSERAKNDKQTTVNEVIDFFAARLEQLLVDEGHNRDIVQAVLAVAKTEPLAAKRKTEALSEFAKTADYHRLAVAFKRTGNILAKQGQEYFEAGRPEPQPQKFVQQEEQMLWEAINKLESRVHSAIKSGNYLDALEALTEIKEDVDRFFDEVLVMADNKDLRINRLALLARLHSLFADIADFRKVSVK